MDRIKRAGQWAIWAVALCGCSGVGTVTPTTDAGVSTLQFQDIPVPAGLHLVEGASDSREIGGYRYGNFVYTGSAPLAELGTYLLERMPQHSWQLVEDLQPASSRRVLRFRRGRYVADCVLTRQLDARSRMEIAVRTTTEAAAPDESTQSPEK